MKNTLFVLVLIVAVVAVGATAYLYNELNSIKKDPQKVAQEEIDRLLVEVEKLIVLPEGETPTVATVDDPEVLKDQPFFANASKGDKILIYAGARKAILYNPTTKKIVEVAPIILGEGEGAAASTPPPSAPSTEVMEEEGAPSDEVMMEEEDI
ncbi:hypothetical protein L0Y49_00200 [bacterium]|nr:hypothetical protein [bacterium]MCI0566548.1 hypothetical protein [bacterium]